MYCDNAFRWERLLNRPVSGENEIWKTAWPVSQHSVSPIQVTRKGGVRDAVESRDGKLLFYMKGPGEGRNSVWRVPVRGGEETPILPSVLNNNFAVVEKGIYFIPDSQPFSVRFQDFATGKVITVANLAREPAWSLSVSPDGRNLLYSEFEGVRADLVLVDNFR